jgi:hypothetical protein
MATKPGLLKAELLPDHPDTMFNFGLDVGLGCLD